MGKVIIEIDNKILTNSIAIWFESGAAMEAFKDSGEYNVIEELREEGTEIPEIDLYPTMLFDADEIDEVEHTVILNLED